MDSSSPRDGRAIEELGYYHPVERQNQVKINKDKFHDWIGKGAIPSDTVKSILNKSNFKVEN